MFFREDFVPNVDAVFNLTYKMSVLKTCECTQLASKSCSVCTPYYQLGLGTTAMYEVSFTSISTLTGLSDLVVRRQKTHKNTRVVLMPSVVNTPIRNKFPHNWMLPKKGRGVGGEFI